MHKNKSDLITKMKVNKYKKGVVNRKTRTCKSATILILDR